MIRVRPHTGILLTLLFTLQVWTCVAVASSEGQFFGTMKTEYPDWFKISFLDLQEDLEEATDAGRKLAIFFHQDGCPYCNALVERNFSQKEITEKVQANFDSIAINMWGDRSVIHLDGEQYTEKTLAEELKVQFTPTVLFFDQDGSVILRINGYHGPQRFILALDYVANYKPEQVSYRDFIKENEPTVATRKSMQDEIFFNKIDFDYSSNGNNKKRPFAVFFEQKDCPACDRLHDDVLPDKDLMKIVDQFDATQLDMWAATPIITPQGQEMTARQWAQELNIQFAPSIVIFDTQSKEVIRSEAFFKVFHIQAMFHYVISEAYKKQPSFQRFLSTYSQQLRKQGRDVDIWRDAQ